MVGKMQEKLIMGELLKKNSAMDGRLLLYQTKVIPCLKAHCMKFSGQNKQVLAGMGC